MCVSPGHHKHRVLLRETLEDAQTGWLCKTSERRNDLLSGKRHLHVLDRKQQHFKEFCRKPTGFEKCLPPEGKWKCCTEEKIQGPVHIIERGLHLQCDAFRVWWCSLLFLSPPWCLDTALEAHNRLLDHLHKTKILCDSPSLEPCSKYLVKTTPISNLTLESVNLLQT